MTKEQIIHLLQSQSSVLKARGVDHLYIFGSVARGDSGPQSDVDLFMDVVPDKGFSLFDLMDIQDYLSDILQVKTDMMTRNSLHPVLKESIVASAEQIF